MIGAAASGTFTTIWYLLALGTSSQSNRHSFSSGGDSNACSIGVINTGG
jgi:hypothetical protein